MKKLFAVLAIAAIITSCNDTGIKAAAESDSARAQATSDSLAEIKKPTDTLLVPEDNATTNTMDSSIKALPKDSIKK